MNASINPVSFKFASSEMQHNGDNVRKYAAQNDNLLLKKMALEVIDAAEGSHEK